MKEKYTIPECLVLTVETSNVLAGSPVTLDSSIKAPVWETDGDYGLE